MRSHSGNELDNDFDDWLFDSLQVNRILILGMQCKNAELNSCREFLPLYLIEHWHEIGCAQASQKSPW